MWLDYVALVLGVPVGSFEVKIVPEVGAELERAVRDARETHQLAERAQAEAATRSRRIAEELAGEGLTGREIAVILGVTPQRVSQLLKAVTRATSLE